VPTAMKRGAAAGPTRQARPSGRVCLNNSRQRAPPVAGARQGRHPRSRCSGQATGCAARSAIAQRTLQAGACCGRPGVTPRCRPPVCGCPGSARSSAVRFRCNRVLPRTGVVSGDGALPCRPGRRVGIVSDACRRGHQQHGPPDTCQPGCVPVTTPCDPASGRAGSFRTSPAQCPRAASRVADSRYP